MGAYFSNFVHCVFEPPFGGRGLETTYDVHLMLIGKRVVDFLLVLTELFCNVLTLRRYERISTENRRFLLQRVQFNPKFQEEGFAALHQPLFLS